MITKNEKNNAMLIHFSGLLSFLVPLGGILGPLVFWSVKKDSSDYVNQEGKAAVNFNLSFALYSFIIGLSIVPIILSNIFGLITSNQLLNNDYDSYSYSYHFDDFNLFGIFGLTAIAFLLQVIRVVFIINSGIKAGQGATCHYPLSIKFIK
ncbi:MAG: DUF4870 domain-containing protein [Flavobacteriaceae bacterium]